MNTTEKIDPDVHRSGKRPRELDSRRLKSKKTLRAIRAAWRSPYDSETKLVLIGNALELREYRDDWDVWPGTRALAKGAGLTTDTVIDRRRILIEDKVLVPSENEWNKTKLKGGRASDTYRLRPGRVEAMTRVTERRIVPLLAYAGFVKKTGVLLGD